MSCEFSFLLLPSFKTKNEPSPLVQSQVIRVLLQGLGGVSLNLLGDAGLGFFVFGVSAGPFCSLSSRKGRSQDTLGEDCTFCMWKLECLHQVSVIPVLEAEVLQLLNRLQLKLNVTRAVTSRLLLPERQVLPLSSSVQLCCPIRSL